MRRSAAAHLHRFRVSVWRRVTVINSRRFQRWFGFVHATETDEYTHHAAILARSLFATNQEQQTHPDRRGDGMKRVKEQILLRPQQKKNRKRSTR